MSFRSCCLFRAQVNVIVIVAVVVYKDIRIGDYDHGGSMS